MQTFLPFEDFEQTAKVLDYRRLGKQRVETKQIINIIENKFVSKRKVAWSNHPAVLMWKDDLECLKLYFNVISTEWIRRGYKHNMGFYDIDFKSVTKPKWLGDLKFHVSHQSNLVRKKPEFYSDKFPNVSPDLPYIWPTKS